MHELDNKSGTDHVSGLYQYVEKVYEAQVFNYGLRTMYEFIIPDPATFFVNALKLSETPGTETEPPKKPELKPGNITEGEYRNIIEKYGLSGVNPPPEEFISVAHSFNGGPVEDLYQGGFFNNVAKVKIPDGYRLGSNRNLSSKC